MHSLQLGDFLELEYGEIVSDGVYDDIIFVNAYLNDVLLIDRDFCLLCPVRFYDDINVLYIEPSDQVFEDYSHMVSTSEFNEGIAEQSLELNVKIQLYSEKTGFETEYKQRFTIVREIINN